MTFFSRDLDLDPMTLIYEFHLNIPKNVRPRQKMKLVFQGFRKLEREQLRQTDDTVTDATGRIITPHSRMVK